MLRFPGQANGIDGDAPRAVLLLSVGYTKGKFAMDLGLIPPLISIGLFAGILVMIEGGRRAGKRIRKRDADGARPGLGAVEGAIFALLGLLIAFTFTGSISRLDLRRQLVVQESNDIGTAWLRIDLLPADAQPAIRDLFRSYVESRVKTYALLNKDVSKALSELDRSNALQLEIWRAAVAACARPDGEKATMLMLPALNQMIDITSTRTQAAKIHTPFAIYGILLILALASAFLAGIGMSGGKTRSWIHILGFAVIISFTVYIILDIEYPRRGLIRMDAVDKLLVEVRAGME